MILRYRPSSRPHRYPRVENYSYNQLHPWGGIHVQYTQEESAYLDHSYLAPASEMYEFNQWTHCVVNGRVQLCCANARECHHFHRLLSLRSKIREVTRAIGYEKTGIFFKENQQNIDEGFILHWKPSETHRRCTGNPQHIIMHTKEDKSMECWRELGRILGVCAPRSSIDIRVKRSIYIGEHQQSIRYTPLWGRGHLVTDVETRGYFLLESSV